MFADDIPLDLARRAHSGTSFSPESRAESERSGYVSTLEGDYARLAKYADTEEKRTTLTDEFSRYRAGYRARYIAYLGARSRCMSTMITGPSNFPVARQAKRNAHADKRGAELLSFRERALAAIEKVLRPELRPIMAGDDDATSRLTKKIADAEQLQTRMKACNLAIRKHAKAGAESQIAALVALGLTEGRALDLLQPDFCGRIGFANYELTNNNANIRRMKARLVEITRNHATDSTEIAGEHARYEDAPADNRVRLFFPGKPSDDVRARLKGAGFRWTPSLGCWQAYRNRNTMLAAQREAGLDHSDAAGSLCTEGPDGCCTTCGVAMATCHMCTGVGYHARGCHESEDTER